MEINQNIPLAFRKILNGAPVTGLTVTVTVFNAQTNAVLLSSTSVPEVASGVYIYVWSGVTSFTNCRISFSESGNAWDEFITISDDDDTVERLSSRAV